ncbi:MAG: FKBP-type peptidyl-prolyl cis-trans isomerase, partial [Elusimicrobia bacterium]|nr:FKBP-type peptidyl-prolyl cis-trans isomerase [Elusimicrobiota bacterium]
RRAGSSSEQRKIFYTLGYYMGRNAAQLSLSSKELKWVEEGFHAAALGKPSMTDLRAFGPKVNALASERIEATLQREAGRREAREKSFLAKAAAQPGARKLSSGLIFKSLSEGKGAKPTAEDMVKVDYEGKLVDGKIFDSSYQRGEPATFPLKGVIKCWTEGVALMRVGGTAQLVCPPSIAYGEEGRPPTIPPGATLVFKVQLLDIVKPTADSAK